MKILLVIIVVLGAACGLIASDKSDYLIVNEFSLGPELAETSGLYCPDDTSIFTINDSGNAPVVYQLNVSGEIVNKIELDKKNTDWESITGDEEHFYIGDIGNNNGKRKYIDIFVVDKNPQPKVVNNTLRLTYTNNPLADNEYLNHDFDAEALVSVDDDLLLFSKSWKSNVAHVYKLSKTKQKQDLTPFTSIEGLPGLVTGIDYDKHSEQFVVVGYSLRGFGSFMPYIGLIDKDFKVADSYPLEGFNQVEGVCVSPNGTVWISQESSFFSTHKLAKLKFN